MVTLRSLFRGFKNKRNKQINLTLRKGKLDEYGLKLEDVLDTQIKRKKRKRKKKSKTSLW